MGEKRSRFPSRSRGFRSSTRTTGTPPRSRTGACEECPRRLASSAHREVPKRAPDAALRRILERRGVKVGQMAGRAVVWPAETNFHLARPLDDELLHRSWIVTCGDRGAEAADRPILVEPEPAVGRGHPNQVGGCVIGDDKGPELAFTPVIALTRHRPGRQTRRRGGD